MTYFEKETIMKGTCIYRNHMKKYPIVLYSIQEDFGYDAVAMKKAQKLKKLFDSDELKEWRKLEWNDA